MLIQNLLADVQNNCSEKSYVEKSVEKWIFLAFKVNLFIKRFWQSLVHIFQLFQLIWNQRNCAVEAIFCCPTENSHHLKS